MLQVEPKEPFPIVRQLEDPTDTTTRYVRAKVYKAASSATAIDTVNLTDNGGQFFSKNYEIPADDTGKGMFLLIIIKVYDDSGYTTESKRYARTYQELLVQQRWNWALGMGGGADVKYEKIRDIIQDEIKKIPEVDIKEVNLEPLLKAIKKAESRIGDIDIPKQEKTDLRPIFEALTVIRQAVLKKPEKPDKPDLSPIQKAIKDLQQSLEQVIKSFDQTTHEIKKPLGLIEKYITSKKEKPKVKKSVKAVPKLRGYFGHLMPTQKPTKITDYFKNK